MTRQVVLASRNRGKLHELARVLADLPLELVPQPALGISEVEESGQTFVENALLKARHAAALSGLPAIADDSGLEVDALDGAPGIHSARYAGPHASDEENVQKLLRMLAGVAEGARAARFQCLLVYLRHARDPTPIICHGSWRGRILARPAGHRGFGYDPVFGVPGQGCSAAELAPALKDRLSHRGEALRKLREALGSSS